MALKNKDGTIFKLRSPNPIMKNQEIWEDFQIHNMNWNQEIVPDLNYEPIIPVKSLKKSFLEELEEAKPAPEKPKIPEIKVNKLFIHCLPAILKEKTDEVYGDKYKVLEYLSPFSFEGVIVNQQDLFISIWTTAEIQESSILYPKNNQKRWWKVQEKIEKTGGWLLNCIPSDYQPYFDS